MITDLDGTFISTQKVISAHLKSLRSRTSNFNVNYRLNIKKKVFCEIHVIKLLQANTFLCEINYASFTRKEINFSILYCNAYSLEILGILPMGVACLVLDLEHEYLHIFIQISVTVEPYNVHEKLVCVIRNKNN